MNLAIIAAIAYGILSFVGGVMGYVQAKSKASLISGIASGLLLILAGIVQLQGMQWGLGLGAIVTMALIIVFALRLAKTRKFMPAGLMITAGIAALVAMIVVMLPA